MQLFLTHKYLGVICDQGLYFQKHITTTCKITELLEINYSP